MILPIPGIQHKLAKNPNLKPKYSTSVKLSSGEEILVADPKITRALIALMDMSAVLGGAASHYGGPAAFAEMMSVVHGMVFTEAHKKNKNWFELFHIINDAGHCENGLYALKANYGFANLSIEDLKKFRSIESKLTGHGEAHLFPEAVYLSNGPLGSSLPQAQGLAMADALAGNFQRVTITTISDGACMEGEAREALASIPGLANKKKLAPFVLIISDNNTKLSGRIDQESFSMQPTFKSLENLGWKILSLENGNDLNQVAKVVEHALGLAKSQPTTPIAIHAKTVKGIGTKKTAESSSGGHGFPLKSPTELTDFLNEILGTSSWPAEFKSWQEELLQWESEIKKNSTAATQPEEKIQAGVSSGLIRAVKSGMPIVSLTSDLPGSTGVSGFRKEFPNMSYDLGVAESNMISAAAGFSKAGFIPVVDTFAQFGVTKGALPLTMAMLSQAPMICVFSHTGFQDAADGASHQALSYIAMVSSIPEVDVYMLTCSEEANELIYQACEEIYLAKKNNKNVHSKVFFLGRENFPKNYSQQAQYKLSQGQTLFESGSEFKTKVCLCVGGSLLPQAFEAKNMLEQKGVGAVIFNPSIINRPDLKSFSQALQKTKGLVVMAEDHQMIGGMNQILSFELIKSNIQFKAKYLAVDGEFGQSAYNAIELYRKHHIDAQSIYQAAMDLSKTTL
jgi:transketolase